MNIISGLYGNKPVFLKKNLGKKTPIPASFSKDLFLSSDIQGMALTKQIAKIIEEKDPSEINKILSLPNQTLSVLQKKKIRILLANATLNFIAERKQLEMTYALYPEDPTLVDAILSLQKEERKYPYLHFYVGEPLHMDVLYTSPWGFLFASLSGFLGCVSFLMLQSFFGSYLQQQPAIALGAFFLLVMVPWISLIRFIVQETRYIIFNREGLEFVFWFKKKTLLWKEVGRVFVVMEDEVSFSRLDRISAILLVPVRESEDAISIDLDESTSSFPTKRLLLDLIGKHVDGLHPVSESKIDLKGRRVFSI